MDGSNDYALTSGDSYDTKPAWSPDDRQIAFLSSRDAALGEFSLYVVDADGSNLQRIGSAGASHTPGSSFAWSPDGRSFAIFDGSQLFVLDRETGERFVLFTIEGIDYISGVTWQP
jgi:Tol biopolymer transport system component